jgi:hypothetical protein
MIARKPFTLVAALLFLIITAAHLYRLAVGLQVEIGGTAVPQTASWLGAAIAGLLGVMLVIEARR